MMPQPSRAAIKAMQVTGSEEEPISESSADEVSSTAEHVDVARLLSEHLPEVRNELAHVVH